MRCEYALPGKSAYSRAGAFFLACWMACAVWVQHAPAQGNSFWQSQSIYQIVTDRFFDGNPANDNAEGTYAPNDPTGVHGGDFAGIEQKLDYLQTLGVTAIWISPIVLNTEGQFHGYSAWNFYALAPHWGTLSNLQQLVQAAHARGIQVIDDIVVNHAGDLVQSSGNAFNYPAGYNLSYVDPARTYPPPFELSAVNPMLTNLFHNYGYIDNFNNSTQTVLGWLDGLNDFRTETAYVRTNMAAIYEYWIKEAGFDAFRVDTALEVDQGFWQSFCPAIHSFASGQGNPHFFMFAEVYTGSDATVGAYTGTQAGGSFEFDSTLDYPLYYAIQSVFALTNGATAQVQNHFDAVAADYAPAARMQLVTFLDNHDNPRFLSANGAAGKTNLLTTALAFLYSYPGIPCLYYGTEQGFDGTTDPDDREDMFAGEFKDGPGGVVQQLSSPGRDDFDMANPLYLWVAKLNNLRRLYPALSLGSYTNRFNAPGGPGGLAFSRILNNQEVIALFNTSGAATTLGPFPVTYPAGTVLVNLLDTRETVTVGSGNLLPAVSVPGTSAKLFLAQAQWKPLNPMVCASTPSHWTANVDPFSPVSLQFDQGMDPASTESAFSVQPMSQGSFTWTSQVYSNDTLTFTPGLSGLVQTSLVTVTVSVSAKAAGPGLTLGGPYHLAFHTTVPADAVFFSSPATNNQVVLTNGQNPFVVQVCFSAGLDTNDPTLFSLYINGVLQPRSGYVFRPPGAVPGCAGMRSLLYNWMITTPGTNLLEVVYTNQTTVLEDARAVLAGGALFISGLAGPQPSVQWSSTPGLAYQVLATTNLNQPFQPVSGTLQAQAFSTTYPDPSNSPPALQKFYKVVQVP